MATSACGAIEECRGLFSLRPNALSSVRASKTLAAVSEAREHRARQAPSRSAAGFFRRFQTRSFPCSPQNVGGRQWGTSGNERMRRLDRAMTFSRSALKLPA